MGGSPLPTFLLLGPLAGWCAIAAGGDAARPKGGAASTNDVAGDRRQLVLDDGQRWEVRGLLVNGRDLVVFRDGHGRLSSVHAEHVVEVTPWPEAALPPTDATPPGVASTAAAAEGEGVLYTNADLPEPFGWPPSRIVAFPATDAWLATLATRPRTIAASDGPFVRLRSQAAMATSRIEGLRYLSDPVYGQCAGVNRINRVNRFTARSLREACEPRERGHQRVPRRGAPPVPPGR